MPGITDLRDRASSATAGATSRARLRHPLLDHAVRAYRRADEVLWGQLAGGITYFGFLSLFPLIAVGFALLSYLTVVSTDIRDGVEQAVLDAFPGLLGDGPNQIQIDDIAGAGAGAGIVGTLALLWTGTGAVDAVRDGIRVVFGTTAEKLSLPYKKLRDLLVLVVVGALLVASVAVSAVTTSATSLLLDRVGLGDSGGARIVLSLLTLALALGLNTLILALLFRLLSGRALHWRQVRGGALLGAVGLEVLKLLATLLLGGTRTNPLYATFAVVVALLLWINFSARVLMISAAWVATEPDLLAEAPDAQAVHPAQLPLVVAPGLPAPRRWQALPCATAAVLTLVALAVRRRSAARPGR